MKGEPTDLPAVQVASDSGSPSGLQPQPKRTRGARGGQKHPFEASDKRYAETCDIIASHMAAFTYKETGRAWHLPFIKPLAARRNYPEWYRYVVHHADAWADTPEDGLVSLESLRAWAAILPEFWTWYSRYMQEVINGVDQPLYRFPPGCYQNSHQFIPLRSVIDSDDDDKEDDTGKDGKGSSEGRTSLRSVKIARSPMGGRRTIQRSQSYLMSLMSDRVRRRRGPQVLLERSMTRRSDQRMPLKTRRETQAQLRVRTRRGTLGPGARG